MSKGDVPEPRQAIFDELGVARTGDPTGLYVSLSEIDVVDLISEGEIEGIVSGEYRFDGTEEETGYQKATFTPYTALDESGNCNTGLGFLRSIYWNEVPVVDKDGFYNFQEINVETTNGLPQGKLPTLNPNLPNDKNFKGSEDFELTLFRNIGERLYGPTIDLNNAPGYYNRNTSPNSPTVLGEIDRNAKTYIISNKECVGVRVNIRVARLLEQIQDDHNDNIKEKKGDEDDRGFFAQPEKHAKRGKQQAYGAGDMRARKIKYQIYTRPIFDTRNVTIDLGADPENRNDKLFAPWKETPDINDEIFGRIEEAYVRSVDINFNTGLWKELNPRENDNFYNFFNGWEIKIVRLTPDSVHTFLKNDSYVDSIIEVYDSKLRYPYSAMAYSKFSAEFFSRIPKRAYDTKLLKVKIPTTYDPIKRTYTEPDGFWDGCFKIDKAWTNNPAWCFYDLLTNNRYGLGEYIDSQYVDKWTLYDIAKYCDVLVPDGKGGLEPRFTLNHIITSREEAYKVVNDLASAFRSLVYYAFGNIYVSQDREKDAIYQFTTSNVVDGIFNYTSSAKKARHTVAIVRYNDKNNNYQPAISYTEDEAGIQRYGIREIETSAIGCTSEGQARRFGEWILKSEILETESVTFTAGQEGMYIRPGDVIKIFDEFRSDRNLAGRTFEVQELNSGIIPSSMVPSTISSDDFPITGNSIIIDKAIEFTPDKEYKLSVLTPTNYYEPTQITPDVCEESEVTEEVEVKIYAEKSVDGAPSYDTKQTPTALSTDFDLTVDSAKGEYSFEYSKGGLPKRYEISYVDSEGETLYLETILRTFKKERKIKVYLGDRSLPGVSDIDKFHLDAGNTKEQGDLKACLAEYAANGTAAEKVIANREIGFLEFEGKGGDAIKDAPASVQIKQSRGVQYFTKPEGVTAIKITVLTPINTSVTTYSTEYYINFKRTATFGTETQTVSTTNKSTNTDKALTSADTPEIRKNQIQTVNFSGFQAVVHTGNYSSDFTIGGSGIVTQIFLDSGSQNLDFDNYVITGYSTASVIGDLSRGNDGTDYSASYENPSGANLVWSIEPVDPDSSADIYRDYTLDAEVASGYCREYRVINITENEKKYDVVALEYNPIKYDWVNRGGGRIVNPEVDENGPAENPRVEIEDKQITTDPGPQLPGAIGACCQDYGNTKECSDGLTKGSCDDKDKDMRSAGVGTATWHVNKKCEDIDCSPKIVVNPPRNPIEFPEDPEEPNAEQLLNLDFKMSFDLTSFSTNSDIRGYRLQQALDIDVFDEAQSNEAFNQDMNKKLGAYIYDPKLKGIHGDYCGDYWEENIGGSKKTCFEAAMGKYYNDIFDNTEGECHTAQGMTNGCSYLTDSNYEEYFSDAESLEQAEVMCWESTYEDKIRILTEDNFSNFAEDESGNYINFYGDTSEIANSFMICRECYFTDLGFAGQFLYAGKTTVPTEEDPSGVKNYTPDKCYDNESLHDGSERSIERLCPVPIGSKLFEKTNTTSELHPYCLDDDMAQKSVTCPAGERRLAWYWDNPKKVCEPPNPDTEFLVNLGEVENFASKSTEGTDAPSWFVRLRREEIFPKALPQDRYLVLIQRFVYKFPNFLRDDDNNPVSQLRSDEATTDIRSIPFHQLEHNVQAITKNVYLPPDFDPEQDDINDFKAFAYKEGCECDASHIDHYKADRGGSNVISTGTSKAKPYADINLAYTDAIVPGTSRTIKHIITNDQLETLSECGGPNRKRNLTIHDKNIKPETIFKLKGAEDAYNNIITSQKDKIKDYLADGQYLVYFVSIAQEKHGDNTLSDSLDCHDQVGIRFAFAMNLKDEANYLNSQTNSACQVAPAFLAKKAGFADFDSTTNGHDRTTMPKLYDIPQVIIDRYFIKYNEDEGSATSFMPMQLPGKLYELRNQDGQYVKGLNISECVYLAGQLKNFRNQNDNKLYYIDENLQKNPGPQGKPFAQGILEVVPTDENGRRTTEYFPGTISDDGKPLNKRENHSALDVDFITATSVEGLDGSLTLISTQNSTECRKIATLEDTYGKVEGVHFELAEFDSFGNIAIDKTSLHTPTGEDDPEETDQET